MTIASLQSATTENLKQHQLPKRLENFGLNLHYHIADKHLTSLDELTIPMRAIEELRYIFVTGSGPSLIDSIPLLQFAAKRTDCLIISGATNAGYLLSNNIYPHIVTVVDTSPAIREVLQTLYNHLSMSLLAVPVWADPTLINEFKGPTGFFMELLESNDPYLESINAFIVHSLAQNFVKLSFGAFGSSIPAQVQCAELYRQLSPSNQIKNIYLCGADFGFQHRSTTRAPRIQYNDSIQEFYEVFHDEPTNVIPDQNGGYTTPVQLLYRLGLMEVWHQTEAPLRLISSGTKLPLMPFIPTAGANRVKEEISNGNTNRYVWQKRDIEAFCEKNRRIVEKLFIRAEA